MQFKHDFYFVGNAHLDPVWMWRWQEGSCEAKATIRSALDRMNEYPEFIFVCSAARVFEWIEEFDPKMFEEIKLRVKEGRFVIVGGWYIQPDCNLPAGEGFARQGLYSQRYFKEKFGVTAKTGYNVDSFGHNGMLPQILRKQGMENYIFFRPGLEEKSLPCNVFRWRSPDGSEVVAARLLRVYNTSRVNIDEPEHLCEMLAQIEASGDENIRQMFFFYGVGNHGGGPTKKNIENIISTSKLHPESKFIFSTADDFFDSVRSSVQDLPIFEDDLQHHASGCYSAVSQIKNDIRRAECELISAEKFGMMAHCLTGRSYPDANRFKEAWKNVLFSHFHDSFGGCSIKEVYDDASLMLGESRFSAAREENNALQTVSWKIDTSDAGKGIPIILFNPHDFPAEQTVTVNKHFDRVFDCNGREIPCQRVHSPAARCRRITGDTVFFAHVPPFGYTSYYVKRNQAEGSCQNDFETGLTAGEYFMENKYLRAEFDPHGGYITSLFDKEQGRELLRAKGAVPVVIDEHEHDTWSHGKNFFDSEIGIFTDAEIKVLETGPVRTKIKVISRYGKSVLTQYFILTPESRELTAECFIDWHEKQKMLKLRFETDTVNPEAYYEIPFGIQRRPADGEEEPGLMWAAVNGDNGGLAVINDNKYSFSVKEGDFNLTVVRSPYYTDHGRGDQNDTECELTEQGKSTFGYCLMPITEFKPSDIIKKAKLFNTPVTLIMENNHSGVLPDSQSCLECDSQNILISAFKRAEDGKGIVIRAYETDGRPTDAVIFGRALPAELRAHFTPYSVNTYYLADTAHDWREVMMTEYDFGQ